MKGRHHHIHWIFFASIFTWGEIVTANVLQNSGDTVNSEIRSQLDDMEDFFEEFQGSASSKDSPANFLNLGNGSMQVEMDSTTKLKYLEAYQGYLNNNLMNYQHSQRVFRWQLTSSKLIFITVIIVVMAGIVFSGLQFKKGTNDSRTELEISRDGLKVNSSILGVIILVISLVFFYLYLVYVYPIQEIF